MSDPAVVAADADCAQPSDTGCPIVLHQPARAAVVDPGDVHTWRLSLLDGAPVRVTLTDLPADYDLHVYGPDGGLVGESTNDGTQDDVVDVATPAAGTYSIYVDSPRGESSPVPYALQVELTNRASPGQVLLADNFDDPANGWLPQGTLPNGGISRYLDGEYQLAKTDPASNSGISVIIPGTYADTTIALDVRMVDLQSAQINVRCRANGDRAYRAEIRPEERTIALARVDGDPIKPVYLVSTQPSSAVRRGVANHIELTCVGPNISLAVNGTNVAAAQDTTYTSGVHQVTTGVTGKTSDIRLDNLVVTQR